MAFLGGSSSGSRMNAKRKNIRRVMKYYESPLNQYEGARWRKRRYMTECQANEFFVGVMLDQGQDLERAWAAGSHFCRRFESDSNLWEQVASTRITRLRKVSRLGFGDGGDSKWRGAYACRNVNKFPEWIKSSAQLILDKYDSDVRNLWKGVKAKDVGVLYDRFREFPGIGDALAKMAQFILVRSYGVGGGEKNKSKMRVKPDIHVRRVTHRIGLTTQKGANVVADEIEALGLDSPADFDFALLHIGREFCKKSLPLCSGCPITPTCQKVGVA